MNVEEAGERAGAKRLKQQLQHPGHVGSVVPSGNCPGRPVAVLGGVPVTSMGTWASPSHTHTHSLLEIFH